MKNQVIYNVQCKTAAVARDLLQCGNVTSGNHLFAHLRLLPAYRTDASRKLRSIVAAAVRLQRK